MKWFSNLRAYIIAIFVTLLVVGGGTAAIIASSHRPAQPGTVVTAPPSQKSTPSPSEEPSEPAPPTESSKPPSSPAWSTSHPFGGIDMGGYYLYNNCWNMPAEAAQTMWANSYHEWGVVSTQGIGDPTAVKTYPCVQKNLPNIRADQFTKMISAYTAHGPGEGIYNISYDIWFNGLNKEVMFWVDKHWGDLGPPREVVTLGGQTWLIYHDGGYTRFLLDHSATSGDVDLLAGLSYMLDKGWLLPSDICWQVCFGFEVCNTDGQPLNYAVTNYSLDVAY